jgi:hypothetical protein
MGYGRFNKKIQTRLRLYGKRLKRIFIAFLLVGTDRRGLNSVNRKRNSTRFLI